MRKKGSIAAVVFLSVLIAALVALAVFLILDYRSTMQEAESYQSTSADTILKEIQSAEGAVLETPKDEATEAITEESESEEEWVLALNEIKDTPLIWVGDSRTLGMQKAVEKYSGDVFIGESGEGYVWFSDDGVSKMKTAIKNHPDWPVIFNLGVNDYENITNYMDLYGEILEEYPDTTFYFLSVNPVDDDRVEAITNDEIDDFNDTISSEWPDAYIDSCSYLIDNDIETSDGIHYSADDYRKIYLFVKDQLSA